LIGYWEEIDDNIDLVDLGFDKMYKMLLLFLIRIAGRDKHREFIPFLGEDFNAYVKVWLNQL
jgi:hypothetical protein